MRISVPYGRAPLEFETGDRHIEVLRAPDLPAPRPISELLAALPAFDIARGARVTLIVSDPTRAEPRADFVAAIRRRLPDVELTLAIATGTHGPCRLDELGLDLNGFAAVVNHDGHSPVDLVELGTTEGGTPVRVHRCVVETDHVIATGCIRPHYFAGFGAGAKAIFPGLGEATAIRINHRLKTAYGARAGIVDGNPCRLDLEAAVRMVPAPITIVNGVSDVDHRVREVVVGDFVRAFRAGCEIARPWFTVRGKRAPLVIASDALPVTASLYQAAKIFAAVAPLVEEGGRIVVAAECAEGVEPIDTVNEAIFRIGVLPRLPRGVSIGLVSAVPRAEVARTLVEYVSSIDIEIGQTNRVLVVPMASQLLCEADA
ncbi:MAG: lactate racemase domain-containing protein [Kofleriaceae bacterium]